MLKVGDTKQAWELGLKGSGRHLWAPCELCGRNRWTLARGCKGNYRVESKRCRDCANKLNKNPDKKLNFPRWAKQRQKRLVYRRWDNARKSARESAHRRGLECATLDDFEVWYRDQDKLCYYCGRPFGEPRDLDGETTDRLDNNEGYTVSNMVLACRRCNIIKGSWFTPEQMIHIANDFFV